MGEFGHDLVSSSGSITGSVGLFKILRIYQSFSSTLCQWSCITFCQEVVCIFIDVRGRERCRNITYTWRLFISLYTGSHAINRWIESVHLKPSLIDDVIAHTLSTVRWPLLYNWFTWRNGLSHQLGVDCYYIIHRSNVFLRTSIDICKLMLRRSYVLRSYFEMVHCVR